MDDRDDIYQAFRTVPWFSGLSEEHLEKLAMITQKKQFKNGERIFHEGDKQDNIYILTAGRIALDIFVPHHGKVRISTIEEMDLFGWSGVTPGVHQRTAGAVAVVESTALAIDAEKLSEFCEGDHDLGYLVMRWMAEVVASRLMETRLQLLDIFAQPTETQNVQ